MGEYDDDYRPSYDERLQRAEDKADEWRKRAWAANVRAEQDMRDLQLLERVRAHPDLSHAVKYIADLRDGWRSGRDERFAELFDTIVRLLAPGDAGRGEGNEGGARR